MSVIPRLSAFVLILLSIASPARSEPIVIESIPGQPFFAFDYDGTTDFSGISHLDGDDYFVVSDKERALYTLRIAVDPETGRIKGSEVTARHPVKSKFADFEGIAYIRTANRILISAETGPGLVSVGLAGGKARDIDPPPIFKKARANNGLEALTSGSDVFWTANEGALEGDGPTSGARTGTLVRLQKLNADFAPTGQYAYLTEASPGNAHTTGVSDLLAMPNGSLLILERIATPLGLAVGIFAVDFTDATDTGSMNELRPGKFRPVRKKRLALIPTLTGNFEGITLGPKLEGGWRSIILIADSGGSHTHLLMALRFRLEENAGQPPDSTP